MRGPIRLQACATEDGITNAKGKKTFESRETDDCFRMVTKECFESYLTLKRSTFSVCGGVKSS